MSDTNAPPPPVPAGWYPDPANAGAYRWWTGSSWGEASAPPAPPLPQNSIPTTVIPPYLPVAQGAPPAPPPHQDSIPTTVIPPYPPVAQSTLPPTPARNALALWALILGIAGLLLVLLPFAGLALGAAAIALGVLGLAKSRAIATGRGSAITGIILGAIAAAVGLALTLAVLLGAAARTGATTDDAAPAPAPTLSHSALAPSPSPTQPAPVAPSPAETLSSDGDPDFVEDSRDDLDDFAKDLDDMIVTLDEDGFWRLLSNSVELSFNYGQLAAREAPASIAADWAAQLAVLDGQITRITEAVADERNDDLRAVIAEAQAQLAVLNGVLDRAGT